MSEDSVRPYLNVDILDQAICQVKHFNDLPKTVGDILRIECSGGHVVEFVAGHDLPGVEGDLQWYLKV